MNLDHQQGVSAEVEEVVVQPNPVEVENLFPYVKNVRFHISEWERRKMVSVLRNPMRLHLKCFELLAIYFAARHEWDFLNVHEFRRDHVFRERLAEECPQHIQWNRTTIE